MKKTKSEITAASTARRKLQGERRIIPKAFWVNACDAAAAKKAADKAVAEAVQRYIITGGEK